MVSLGFTIPTHIYICIYISAEDKEPRGVGEGVGGIDFKRFESRNARSETIRFSPNVES